MASGSEDLYGSAPERSAAALLLIDVINDLEFEGGDQPVERAEAIGTRELKQTKSRWRFIDGR